MIKKLLFVGMMFNFALAGSQAYFIPKKNYKNFYLDKDLISLKKQVLKVKSYGIFSGSAKFILGYFENLYVPTTSIPPGTKFMLNLILGKNNTSVKDIYFKPDTSYIDTYFIFPTDYVKNVQAPFDPIFQVGSTDGKVSCVYKVNFITNKPINAYRPYSFMYINNNGEPRYLSFEMKLTHILNPDSYLLYKSQDLEKPRYSNIPINFNINVYSDVFKGINLNQSFNSNLTLRYLPQFALLTDNITKESIREHILSFKIVNNKKLLGNVNIVSGKLKISFSADLYLTICLEKNGKENCLIKDKFVKKDSNVTLDPKLIFEKYKGGKLKIYWKFPYSGETTIYLPYSDLQNAKVLHICNIQKPNFMKLNISLKAKVVENLPEPICKDYSYTLFKGNILELPKSKIQYVSLEVIGNGKVQCYDKIGKLYPLYCINIDVSKYRPKDASNYAFKFIITNAKPEEIVVSSKNIPSGASPVYHKNPYRY